MHHPLTTPLELSLPIPAFRFEAMAAPELELLFNMHFGFGIHADKGFYFVTDYDDGDDGDGHTNGEDPEIDFTATIDLGPNLWWAATMI